MIENNYIISNYSASSPQWITSFITSSTTQQVTTQSVTQSILNNHTWVKATGSAYNEWIIISGTADIATLNPNNTDNNMANGDNIGARIQIRDNEIFTNVRPSSTSAENCGIAIYQSSSVEGWHLEDYINIPTSSVSGNAGQIANEFSLDGSYLVTPIDQYHGSSTDGRLLIYRSSSAEGWKLEQTLTTSSYNAGAAVNESYGQFAYIASVVNNNKIFAGGFYSGTYNRFVAFFNSSSVGGWTFEDEVQIGDSSMGNVVSDVASGVAFDFDGTTAILGSKQNDGSQFYHNASGKLHILESGSGGWSQVTKLGLKELGFTNSVTSSFGSYDATPDQEYRTWKHFAYQSCVVSGSYIAASAYGKEITQVDGTCKRQKHSVFILKSGSGGWGLETRIDDPATNLVMAANCNATSDSDFGLGLALKDNVLVVNSPFWRSDWSSSVKFEGRAYTYVSTSAGGWTLDQTINNPYSGSVFMQGTYGKNLSLGGGNVLGSVSPGSYYYGTRPATSGNLLVLNAEKYTVHPDPNGASYVGTLGVDHVNYETIYGAMVVLEGSASFEQVSSEQVVTESVSTTEYTTSSTNPIPFRVASKSIQNIRDQSDTNYYTTFIGEDRT